jgi:probable HAF family extracellular repeat protein
MNSVNGLRIGVFLVVLAGLSGDSNAVTARFQGLGDLPGGIFRSWASGVSGDGSTAVGSSTTAETYYNAFRWTSSGGMQNLGYLPPGSGSPDATAYSVSADGSTVVGNSSGEAFLWTEAEGMIGLGDLPGGEFWSFARAVSSDGSVVVGEGISSFGWEAYRWTQSGGMVGLGDLPGGQFGSYGTGVSADGSVVAGYSFSGETPEAFRWTEAAGMVGLGDLPGGMSWSAANDLSADSSAVVGLSLIQSWPDPELFEAFRWTIAGGMQPLGDLPGGDYYSHAKGVSADGAIVVGYSSTPIGLEAFIWDQDNGMRNLKSVLENDYGLDLTGWILQEAHGISDDGLTIVGGGTNPSGDTEAWMVTFCADFNNDSCVNLEDYCVLAEQWKQQGPSLEADLVHDGVVNEKDLAAFSHQWLAVRCGCN